MPGLSVLVTGGAGFIGSHVGEALLAAGHRVHVLDNLSTGARENIPKGVQFTHGDLRDHDLQSLIRTQHIDAISHHAAQIDVRQSVADPAFDAEVNVVGSLRLIDAAVKQGVSRIVFASSGGAIYGEPANGPQNEDQPVRPLSPYGCAKLSVEQYLHFFTVVHGLSSVSLRYANVYGPRQSSAGEAGVVAIFIARLLKNEPLIINGSGKQTRDFVLVDDVVRANIAAIEESLTGSFNVGTGVETSINALADLLNVISGRHVAVKHHEAKKGEQMRSVLDGSRLRVAAGLTEPVALQEGLKRTFDWFLARGELHQA